MSAGVEAHTIHPKIIMPPRQPQGSYPGISEDRYARVAVSLARRAVAGASLEELGYILTNDTRSIVSFDRCSLIIHFAGRSWVRATSNDPSIDDRTQFAHATKMLAKSLVKQVNPILIFRDSARTTASTKDVAEATIAASRSFLQSAGSDRLLIIPLVVNALPIGHLVMEFFPGSESVDQQIQSIMEVSPLLSSALLEKLVFEKNPEIRRDLGAGSAPMGIVPAVKRYGLTVLLFSTILCAALFIPVPFTVGGEAEIVSDSTQFAFCRVDGTVKEVLAREGDEVQPGTLVARIDYRELNFESRVWRYNLQILDH